MELDGRVLKEVLQWGRSVDEFQPSHAKDGLTCVQGYVQGATDSCGRFIRGIGVDDVEKMTLFAMNLSWTFWIDDMFDKPRGDSPVDIDSIIRATTGIATSPEATGFFELRTRFGELARSSEDYDIWIDTAVSAANAM